MRSEAHVGVCLSAACNLWSVRASGANWRTAGAQLVARELGQDKEEPGTQESLGRVSSQGLSAELFLFWWTCGRAGQLPHGG